MFCSNCGRQIPDNSLFCNECGNSVSSNVTSNPIAQMENQFQMQKNAIRQSEIQALEQALTYFSQKIGVFNEYDAVSNYVDYYRRGAKSGLIVWGAILSTLGFLLAISDVSIAIYAILIFLLPGTVMILGGILMKINNRKKLNLYTQRYYQLSIELSEFYAQYPNCPVGREYINPNILAVVMRVLKSGRADTIKEAINLILQENVNRKYLEHVQAINANMRAINANTKAIAFFSAANFFK